MHLGPEGCSEVVVLHEGYLPNTVPITRDADGTYEKVLVVLSTGLEVCTSIFDEQGNGIAGATLAVHGVDGGMGLFVGSYEARQQHNTLLFLQFGIQAFSGETDTYGQVCLGLPSGAYVVSAEADGFIKSEARRIDVGQAPALIEPFFLRRGTYVRGLVKDVAGRPVAGAELRGYSGGTLHTAETDENGTFVLGSFPPTAALGELLVLHSGYGSLWERMAVSQDSMTLVLGARTLNLQLHAITEIAAVDVAFVCSDEGLLFNTPEKVHKLVNNHGVVVLERLGTFVTGIVLECPGYIPTLVSLEGIEWLDEHSLDVHLERGENAIAVELRDESGASYAGQATVYVWSNLTDQSGRLLVDTKNWAASADPDGLYRIPKRYLEEDKEWYVQFQVGGFQLTREVALAGASRNDAIITVQMHRE